MNKRIFFIITLLIFFSFPCFGIEECTRINMNDAADIAAENNLDMLAVKLNLKISENEMKQAGRFQNPSLNTFWNYGKAGSGNPQQIGLGQTFEPVKRSLRKKLAKTEYDLISQNIALDEFNLRIDVKEAYIRLVSAKSILKLYEDRQQLLEKMLDNIKNNSEKDFEVIQARIELNQLITDVNEARTAVKTALYNFNEVMNIKGENYDSSDDDIVKGFNVYFNISDADSMLPEFPTIAQAALRKRFDIKIAQNEIEAAKRKLSLVSKERIPDLELQAGYSFQTKGVSDNGRYQNGGYVGANLINLPLFYSYKPEINMAKLELEKARLNYESVKNKALKKLAASFEKFVNARLNLQYYDTELIKDSEKLISLAKKKYESGKSTFTALIVSEESYNDIYVNYIEALTAYYISYIEFLRQLNDENFDLNLLNL